MKKTLTKKDREFEVKWNEELDSFIHKLSGITKIELSGVFYEELERFVGHLRDRAIIQAKKEGARETLEKCERIFEPATSTRGQGGLPITGSITDWKMTVTKYGWEQFKKSLLNSEK